MLPGFIDKGKLNPEDLDGDGEGVEGKGEAACVMLAIFIYLLTYRSRIASVCARKE